jgi:glutathione S-transferase
MLKIHGRANSSNVQKVVWALDEMNVPYGRIDAGGAFGIVGTPEYKAMNPNSRVPTMDDDGFILWESNAIVRYLAAKHDIGGLCPSDPRQRADADRWMDWQQTTVGGAITPIFWNLVRTAEPDRDLAAIEAARLTMIDLMWIIDKALADRPYLAGDTFTMGDIPIAIAVYRWVTLIQDRPAMANLEAWYDRLTQRAALKTNVLDIPLT